MSTRVRKKLSELLCELKVKEIWASSKNTSTLKKLYGNKAQARNLEELDQLWSKVKVLSIYPDKNSGRGTVGNAPFLMLSYEEFDLPVKNYMPEGLALEFRPDILSLNPREEN